jgi:hypothetical protein
MSLCRAALTIDITLFQSENHSTYTPFTSFIAGLSPCSFVAVEIHMGVFKRQEVKRGRRGQGVGRRAK